MKSTLKQNTKHFDQLLCVCVLLSRDHLRNCIFLWGYNELMSRHCLRAACLCRANIKVSSTETGAIFGNIVYESSAYADRSVVVLNDIHIDIMDYISPASCPDVQFRSMWAEFEWENKVGACFTLLCVQYRHSCRL